MAKKRTADAADDLAGYARHYNENALRRKLSQMPRASLLLVLEKALLVRELLLDRDTPWWVRGLLAGALGYLVLPWDLCPDLVPVAGLLDDAAMLALALTSLEGQVTDEIRERADARRTRWSG